MTSPTLPRLLANALKSKRPFETVLLLPSHQYIKVFEMTEPREVLSCVYHFLEEKKPLYYDFKFAIFRLHE